MIDTTAILSRVAEIVARAAKATPDAPRWTTHESREDGRVVTAVVTWASRLQDQKTVFRPNRLWPAEAANAVCDFAAASRTDIPDMAGYIRDLVAALEACRATAHKLFREHMEIIPRARAAEQRAAAADALLSDLLAELDRIYPPTGAFWSGAPKQEAARAHLSAKEPTP